MSCNDVASVLDNHRIALLKPAERADIDAHLASCDDCSAAWQATRELNALRIPATPVTLLERALLASHVPQSAEVRRARAPLIVGSVLLASAALAAGVTAVSYMRSSTAPTAPATAADPEAAPNATDEGFGRQLTGLLTVPTDGATSLDSVNTSLQLVPVVRAIPEYPPAALKKGLEGSVTMKFTVTAMGLVEDPTVVESSDAVFEPAALLAVASWRYLPRIAAGKRTDTADVHMTMYFRLQGLTTPSPPRPPLRNALDAARQQQVSASVWEQLMRDDLRGAELTLDELRATYQLTDFQLGEVWNMYAYLHTLEGN